MKAGFVTHLAAASVVLVGGVATPAAADQPMSLPYRIDRNVRIPMRDGVLLGALVYRPANSDARKPVIATRAGGLPDKVRPDENGWLVDPDDVDGLAAAVAAAASQAGRLARMGARSREIVEREFGWTAVAAAQLAVYAELLV